MTTPVLAAEGGGLLTFSRLHHVPICWSPCEGHPSIWLSVRLLHHCSTEYSCIRCPCLSTARVNRGVTRPCHVQGSMLAGVVWTGPPEQPWCPPSFPVRVSAVLPQPSQGLCCCWRSPVVSPHKLDDCLVILVRGWEIKPKLATYPLPLLPFSLSGVQPCLVFWPCALPRGGRSFS